MPFVRDHYCCRKSPLIIIRLGQGIGPGPIQLGLGHRASAHLVSVAGGGAEGGAGETAIRGGACEMVEKAAPQAQLRARSSTLLAVDAYVSLSPTARHGERHWQCRARPWCGPASRTGR
jgi:hypothetical protein